MRSREGKLRAAATAQHGRAEDLLGQMRGAWEEAKKRRLLKAPLPKWRRGRGRIVEHTLDPWISKLVGAILAIQGSGERYRLGLSIHGFFETNQNSGAKGGGG